MKKIIGICESCGCIIDISCETNYNKTLFICRHCNYPNKIIINKTTEIPAPEQAMITDLSNDSLFKIVIIKYGNVINIQNNDMSRNRLLVFLYLLIACFGDTGSIHKSPL